VGRESQRANGLHPLALHTHEALRATTATIERGVDNRQGSEMAGGN